MEARGHRSAFHGEDAEQQMVGLISLLPQIVDAVSVPVIAAGAVVDGRGIAAASKRIIEFLASEKTTPRSRNGG